MAIDHDVIFLLSFPTSTTSPDVILTTEGTAATSTVLTAYPTTGISYFSLPSAALTYGTVFGLGSALDSTDPATGLPEVIGTSPAGVGDFVSLGPLAVFLSGYSTFPLFGTDGTSAGTTILTPTGVSVTPGAIASLALGKALFVAVDETGSSGLWSTDGTQAGTREVIPSIVGKATTVLGAAGGRVIFATYLAYNQPASLVASDGTAAGTRVIDAAFGSNIPLASISLPNGSLLLTDGSAIYSTDGASAPTLIESFGTGVPAGPGSASIGAFAVLGQGAVFSAFVRAATGGVSSLMFTDGTIAGTHQLALPQPQGPALTDFGPSLLTTFGSRLLFNAEGAVWVTDGTETGTYALVTNVRPVSITVDGSRAFIVISDNNGSDQIYTTDGTAQNTILAISPTPETLVSPGIVDPTHLFVSGTHDQYAVAPTAAGAMAVADTVPGRDGSAIEGGAHVITFADGIGVLDTTGNAEAVARLYQTALARAPDLGGLINFTEQLDAGSMTLIQAADVMVGSPEFLADHGQPGNSDFVTYLYQDDYHRNPDAGGLASFTGALNAGLERGTALLAIAQSYESRVDNLPMAGDANDGTVYRLYQAVQDRAPDPSGAQFFASALANGASVQQVAADMLGSSEYAGKFGNPSDSQFVADLYQNLVHRAADPGGLAAFTGELAAGGSRALLVSQLVGSDEARLVTSQATHDGWVYLH